MCVCACACGGAASMPDLTHVCMHAYVHVCVFCTQLGTCVHSVMYVNPIPFHPVWLSSAATKVHPSGGGREWQHVPLQQLRQETGAHAAGSADGDGSLRKA